MCQAIENAMNMTASFELDRVRILAVCVGLTFCNSGNADSWGPPREFNTLSENRKFDAHVIPGKKDLKPLLIVSSIINSKTNEIWKTELSNRVSPTEVYVADDGKSVVTLDNYFGVGYGDDVVAIYGRSGQLARFSLEQIAPPPKPKPGTSAWLSDRHAYEGKFIHSTASRHWREKSIQFFHEEAGQLLFCVWLDWENRWLVWRMSDGSMISVTSNLSKRLNGEGRTRALNQARVGGFAAAALNFLGRLRFKEDRPLIEAWLRDTEFSCGSMQSSSTDKPDMVFAFTARSYKRETADNILSRWDGKNLEDGDLLSSEKYQFLGTLKCVIAFPTAPAKDQGSIRVYLIPESTPIDAWASELPAHYLIANLADMYPNVFENGQLKEGKLPRDVNFIIYGITPGKYRIKAVWDKDKPFSKEGEILCTPHAGDFESTTSGLVSIRKGADTEGVRIECKKPVID